MPHRDNERDRILISFTLRFYKLFADYGINPEITMVAMAIRLGELEGRRMDVSSLAHAVSLPRSTVIRHLNYMVKRGVVDMARSGRRVTPRLLSPRSPEISAFYGKFRRLFRTTCAQLSKLDT